MKRSFLLGAMGIGLVAALPVWTAVVRAQPGGQVVGEVKLVGAAPPPRVVDVNKAYVAMSGNSRDEAIGQSRLTFQLPDSQQRILELHARALAGEPVQYEAPAVRRDGRSLQLELRGVPMNYVQFCDAGAGRPADMQEMIRQARFDRLPPGEGALPLKDFLDEIPKQIPISLEVPMTRKLPPLEKAKLVYRAALTALGS